MKKINFLLIVFCFCLAYSCNQKSEKESIPWNEISKDIEQELWGNILTKWYPIILDTVGGGYLSNLSSDFNPMENQDKMIVTQARHVWSTSMVAKKNSNGEYLDYASHGIPFLQKMWDSAYGGFYQNVDRFGNPLDINSSKTAYGNAFAIYALSAYFDASGDTAALKLAKKTFYWLEQFSHDAVEGGYFQNLTREGTVMQRTESTLSVSTIGYKDQNSSIHLLEAFTSLYKVWPDSLVQERLSEMFHLVKDVMINDRHYLDLYFAPDLTPISYYQQDSATIMQHALIDHVSFGHDIETAYLLLEASEALGIHADEKLLGELRQILDHSLLGLDPVNGGLFDQGYYFDREKPVVIIKDSKEWWAQAEALNTLLIFQQFYPEAGYDKHFKNQWKYIKKHVIDSDNGGWYIHGLDTRPMAEQRPKASIWKSTYHNYRALANILDILNTKH